MIRQVLPARLRWPYRLAFYLLLGPALGSAPAALTALLHERPARTWAACYELDRAQWYPCVVEVLREELVMRRLEQGQVWR